MPVRGFRRLLACAGLFAAAALFGLIALRAQPVPVRALPGSDGEVTLLPNGWRISPAGRHLQVSDLPLNMILSPDGRFLIVTNNGYAKPSFTVVDTRTFTIAATVPLDDAWLGLAWHPDGKRFYSSSDNNVREFTFADGRVSAGRTFPLGPSPTRSAFAGGLSVRPDGTRLFVVRVMAHTLTSVNIETGRVDKTVTLPAEPYTCLASPDGRFVFVSLWGGARVLAFHADTLAPAGEVEVGEHPNFMLLSRDRSTLFVACANTNAVWAIRVNGMKAREQIGVALYPDSPAGSTPNALALSPEGRTLFVANADNNAVAVVDVSGSRSSVLGFIPTGWYPTSVFVPPDGGTVYVLSGKGLRSRANPNGPNPVKGTNTEYIATLLPGALSAVRTPDEATLRRYTSAVYSLSPYNGKTRLAPADAPSASPVPKAVGEASPIKYVFYIIRENRTYDQVFGDMKQGNGDPSLCLFDETVTPNAHAIARNFVLFDNFYVNAEVSYSGHAYSMAAYSTDINEKMWPANYARHTGAYLSEGGGSFRNAYGNISAPAEGYIWDACARAGISVRSYGEFVERELQEGVSVIHASVPGLDDRFNPDFEPFDLNIPDQQRTDVWLKEFRQFEENGELPRLSIIRLGRDHTMGARAGRVSPTSMVADNDLAVGRVIDAISHSRFWSQSAVFILEDDAQNGPDHVDAHRSVLLAISPFLKRQAVDSTMYTTVSVLRTMELILGLPPMSQLDAAATPLYNAFQATPDLSPFTAEKARVPLDQVNPGGTPAARAAEAFDFGEADLAEDIAFSENVWKAVRGDSATMPPPRRAAFVKAQGGTDRN